MNIGILRKIGGYWQMLTAIMNMNSVLATASLTYPVESLLQLRRRGLG